tara:strand:+ start:1802 stop:2401 length:600 start_codon:yes stop_codon:yes gene_type:complete
MVLILDRQHYGKPGQNDLGAGADLDGDGKVELDEREANLTLLYINAAKEMAEAEGHTVYVLDSGWYSDRHEQAIGIAMSHPDDMCAYIACHLNAGGGDYSLALFDYRSHGGENLATAVAAEMSVQLPHISRHLVRAASPDEWTNGYYTVKGIYAGPGNLSGVCFEPVFMDNEDHQKYLDQDGLALLGYILANACIDWGT